MTKNQEAAHGQEGEDTKHEEEEEELRKKLQPPDDRLGPDVRRLKTHRTTGDPAPEPNERTSDASERPATGRPATSGNPAVQRPSQIKRMSDVYRTSGRP